MDIRIMNEPTKLYTIHESAKYNKEKLWFAKNLVFDQY